MSNVPSHVPPIRPLDRRPVAHRRMVHPVAFPVARRPTSAVARLLPRPRGGE